MTSSVIWSVTGPKVRNSTLSPKTSSVTVQGGITDNDASTKSKILNGHFFPYLPQSSILDLGSSNSYPDPPEITVHPNDVRKLLKNQKPHKASGSDVIFSWFLKQKKKKKKKKTAQPLPPVLTLIFQIH